MGRKPARSRVRVKSRRRGAGEDTDKPPFLAFFSESSRLSQRAEHLRITVVIKKQIDTQLAVPRPVRQLIGAQCYLQPVAALERDRSFDTVVRRVMIGEQRRRRTETQLMGDILVCRSFYFHAQIISAGELGVPDGDGIPGHACFTAYGDGS